MAARCALAHGIAACSSTSIFDTRFGYIAHYKAEIIDLMERELAIQTYSHIAAVAMVLGVLTATNTGAVRPEAVSDGSLITPAWMPNGQHAGRQRRRAAQWIPLRSVGNRRPEAEGEKDAAKACGPQNAQGAIEALRYRRRTYQSSYNGMKVESRATRLPSQRRARCDRSPPAR